MKTDLEASTFQKRPAYRYLRNSDQLPSLDVEESDPIARVKLFNPSGGYTWYISAYDPKSRRAFALVHGQEKEAGYVDMAELVDYRGRFGLPIERDLYWHPKPFSDLK